MSFIYTQDKLKVIDVICNICDNTCSITTITHDDGTPQNVYDCTWIEPGDVEALEGAHVCQACFDKHLVPLVKFKRKVPDDREG